MFFFCYLLLPLKLVDCKKRLFDDDENLIINDKEILKENSTKKQKMICMLNDLMKDNHWVILVVF